MPEPPVSGAWPLTPRCMCALHTACLQVLVIRLRDSLIKMGEELTQAAKSESQQRESSQYYQRRLEELKADMEELVRREAEASRRCMELVSAQRWLSCDGGFRAQACPLPAESEPPGAGLGLWEAGRHRKGLGGGSTLLLAAEPGGGPKWANGIHCCWMGRPARVHVRFQSFFSCLVRSTPKAGKPRGKRKESTLTKCPACIAS